MKPDLYADLIAEGIYSDPAVMAKDMEDDLVDQATGEKPKPAPVNRAPTRVNPDEEMVDLRLAAQAVQYPAKATKIAKSSQGYRQKLMVSLKSLIKSANTLVGSLAPSTPMTKPAANATAALPVAEMIVGSDGVRGGNGDMPGAGTGIPIKGAAAGQIRRRPIPVRKMNGRRLNFGDAANAGMVGTNPMVPGRSAFAKGVE